jgi:hypothetical protein
MSIKDIAKTIAENVRNGAVPIVFDIEKAKGDAKRLMDIVHANSYGFMITLLNEKRNKR